MKKLIFIVAILFSVNSKAQIFYSITNSTYATYGLSSDTKPVSPPNNCYFIEVNTNKTFISLGGNWVLVGIGVDSIATRLAFVTDSLAAALATFTQSRLNDTAAAIRTTVNGKQSTITTGTTAQYFRGDLSLSAFPTTTAAFTNSTNKNFVTDAQATVIGNTSGTNTGDNATNTQYSSDYRAANFIAGTNYLAPNGNGSALTNLIASQVSLGNVTNESKATMFTNAAFTGTFNVADGSIANADLANTAVANLSGTNTGDNSTNTQYSGLAASKADIASPAFTGTPTGIGIPRYAQVTGANVTTTGQALVDITGLTLALVINATYEFEAVLSVSTSAVTTGTAYGVNYSVAGGAVEAQIIGAATSTASKTLRINALNSATALYLATSAQTGGIIIKGRVTTGANAGNFTISHLKLTSGTSTVFIGSFLKVTRIS